MELIAKIKSLGNDDADKLVKFVMEQSGCENKKYEDGSIFLHFDNFNGSTFEKVIAFADNLGQYETGMKRQKTDYEFFGGQVTLNAC